MKKKQKNLVGLWYKVRKLQEVKKNGKTGKKVKNPVWTLNSEQVDYLRNKKIELIPRIFRIKPKQFNFSSSKQVGSILKEVSFAKRNKKPFIHKKLNSRQLKILKEYGVEVKPYKYEIVL